MQSAAAPFNGNQREKQLTKLKVSLAAGLAALALSGSLARAESVPDDATGVWSVVECGDNGLTILANSNAALMVESRGTETRIAIASAELVSGSFVLTIEGEEDELVLPPLDNLNRCDSLPGALPILFAEAVAIFTRLGEIEALCMGEDGITARCVAVAFDMIDVTGDGRFSRAEFSRAIRAAGFFIGHRLVVTKQNGHAFVSLEDLYTSQFAASALGPFIAVNLIDSYDYDGDGFVSPGELLQDRSPEHGLEGAIAGLASEMAPEALSVLMKSTTGMLDLLR